jgi:hypothetical protein
MRTSSMACLVRSSESGHRYFWRSTGKVIASKTQLGLCWLDQQVMLEMWTPPSRSSEMELSRPKSGRALAAWRRTRAIELALAGYCYEDIAAAVGYANRGTAWNVIMEALRRETVEGVAHYRHVELARVDALQAAHWSAAMSGTDTKAAELVLRVIGQRIKLLGIEGPSDADGATRTIVISGGAGEYARDLQAIAEQV